MFKITWSRNCLNNPEKITGIKIIHGYQCSSACYCGYAKICKYRKGFKFHNFSVAVHRFFEYRLHIKLPHLLYINKRWTDLSGTTKCPYKKDRLYTCWDCVYCDGNVDGICLNPKRGTATKKELEVIDVYWGNHHRCGLFKKNEWADNWDKNTGERF